MFPLTEIKWTDFYEEYSRMFLRTLKLLQNVEADTMISYCKEFDWNTCHKKEKINSYYQLICNYDHTDDHTRDYGIRIPTITVGVEVIVGAYIPGLQIGDIVEIMMNGLCMSTSTVKDPNKIITFIDKVYIDAHTPLYMIIKSKIPYCGKIHFISLQYSKETYHLYDVFKKEITIDYSPLKIIYKSIFEMYFSVRGLRFIQTLMDKDLFDRYDTAYKHFVCISDNSNIIQYRYGNITKSSHSYQELNMLSEYLTVEKNKIVHSAIKYNPAVIIQRAYRAHRNRRATIIQRQWREYHYSPGNLGMIKCKEHFESSVILY
jgi:hypothetical protein